GHAIPVDAPARRVLERLGVAEPRTDTAALRPPLERARPKNRGAAFVDLIEGPAHATCVAGEPDCPPRRLRQGCPPGLAREEGARAAAREAAAQARAAAGESARATKAAAKAATKAAAKAAPPPAKSPKGAKGRSGGSK